MLKSLKQPSHEEAMKSLEEKEEENGRDLKKVHVWS